MADGELEKLAGEAATLSDVAREVLRAELSRRAVGIELNESIVPTQQVLGPVILRRFRDLPDALLAKTILDSASVECFLIDENTIRMDWLWSNLLGGVKIWVRPEDIDAAELLDQDWMEAFEVDGVGEYTQPRCPKCRSLEISYRGLVKRLAYASLLVGLPIPVHHPAWSCHSCAYEWEEVDESPAEPK
jgi:hypothetical protein